MKQHIVFLMILFLLLSICGCAQTDENERSFYYLRTAETIRYGQSDAIIAPVSRNITGEDASLDYLLQLYLKGPTEEGYVSPIPKGTYLLSSLWNEDTLVLVLSREFSTLDGIGLTLAGACLTATCHDLTGAEAIEVRSADEIYKFNLTDYAFLDGSTGQ